MRILILSVADKRHMTMIAPYVEYLDSNEIEYDIIRANRYTQRNHDIITDTSHGHIFEINMLFPASLNKNKKLVHFLRFRKKALDIIKKQQYSFIIVWNENTAALFSTFLAFRYHYKFCVNVRDIYTHIKFYRKAVEYAIKYCSFATVPSPEMSTRFPSKTYCLYNKDYSLLKLIAPKTFFNHDLPIRVTHMGFYSKVKQGAKDIVDVLGNDNRFELVFCGQGFDTDFKTYIDEKGYTNVVVKGAFPYEETAEILKNTDIINSYYNRFNHPSLQVSFGIKHSYTPMLYIPGICDENTCWGRLSKKYNIAYSINSSNLSALGDGLYNWYMNLDYEVFKRKCCEFNKTIDSSIEELHRMLDKYIN